MLLCLGCSNRTFAQRFLTDLMDTSNEVGRGIYALYQQNDRLKFSGYMQPQFQWIESKGAQSYAGGDFSPNSNTRFMLRRGRIRIDYLHFNEKKQPVAFLVFQFDGTERGVNIRDFWGRAFENTLQMFALTTGVFARPFGFEVNLSSADRETPERGRMSQTLMKVERDIGAMLTFEPRKETSSFRWLKLDVGLFNGQGLNGPTDYDSHKDLISRLALKSVNLNQRGWVLSAGTSFYYGGIVSESSVIYLTKGKGDNAFMTRDSSAANFNSLSPRIYYGADVQFKIPNKKGATEFRAEYIRGQQTATATSSETPGTYPTDGNMAPLPLFTREFDGGYFYFLQHLGTNALQLVLKYDWYDPNKKVRGRQVDPTHGFNGTDVRYDTFGGGLVYYMNPHVKATIYYDRVINESTNVPGYLNDIPDDVFTCRLQYRF